MKAHKRVLKDKERMKKKNHQSTTTITHWRVKLTVLNVTTVQCPGERQRVPLCYVDGL